MKNLKLPRPETRVRALFDELCRYPNGVVWGDVKAAYDNAPPAYNNKEFGPRSHSNMEIGKLLKKFCTHTGVSGKYIYKLRPEWAQVALKNPFYCLASNVDEGKLRMLADEILEGMAELKDLREGEAVLPPTFVRNPDDIEAGDWVQVKDINSPDSKPLRANHIGAGNYTVEKVEKGFVWLHGCYGGWEPRRFKIVVRPTANHPVSSPKFDKGAPEIRDMAWHQEFNDAYDVKVIEHVSNAEVVQLKAKNEQLSDELQTFSQELIACENNMNEYKDQAKFLMDKTAEWDVKLSEIREQLDRLQHAEVGHVYSMCCDLDSVLQVLQQDVRDT